MVIEYYALLAYVKIKYMTITPSMPGRNLTFLTPYTTHAMM